MTRATRPGERGTAHWHGSAPSATSSSGTEGLEGRSWPSTLHKLRGGHEGSAQRQGQTRALTSELQGRVLDSLLQALHGLHQLLVELLDDLVQ